MGSTAVASLYDRLEETVLERDQAGASEVYYDLVRAERPLSEIVRETTRIHAPYTHVPYHQRIDDGFVRFVNNDHCLLSSRASLALPDYLPGELRYLPMAQTIWYVPSGLDPWNQLLGKAPGHYGRRTYKPEPDAVVPRPTAHWPDQEPLHLDGTFEERLNHWLTLVQCGEVIEAYRVFLGLFEEPGHRHDLLGHMAFAGLIDVQDRMLLNRSYTTGHKSYRARATFEIGEAVGWDQAHDVLYAGVPDMAVGPRWHSAYEMACQVAWTMLAREADQPESSLSPSPQQQPEAYLLANDKPLTPREADELVQALHEEEDMAWINAITDLLLAGKDPKAIVDVIQTAAARVILQVQQNSDFSMPHHGYEYTNTLRWFYDQFDHPHRIKLLYVAGSFINQCALWVKHTPGNGDAENGVPSGAERLPADTILQRVDEAIMAQSGSEGAAWVRTYLAGGYDRKPLVRTLALAAVKEGNDPHNQEIGLCMMEDYLKSTAPERDVLLPACAHIVAGHVKYGDPLEPYKRFAKAFDL